MVDLVTDILLFQTAFSFVLSLNFYNENDKLSYAEYPNWVDTTDGEGSLEFKFKTNKANAFLLSCTDDKKKKKNLVRLTLDSGMLHIFIKMGSDDLLSMKETHIGSQWNDMQWHHVKVIRKYRDITVKIDDHEKALTSDGNADRLILTSKVLVGGDPKHIYDGLTGCIKDLSYPIGSSPKYPTATSGSTSTSCVDVCSNGEMTECKYGGRCIKYFDHSKKFCDCIGTGKTGKKCTKAGLIANFQKSAYMTRSMESLKNFRFNTIHLRFRTNDPSGILMYSGDSKQFFLMELHYGVIKIKMGLRTGEIELSAGNGLLHDGRWHYVIVKRYGQLVTINLDSHVISEMKKFPYYPQESCQYEQDKVYVGGHKYPQYISASSSKQNFEGCLQEVYYQDLSDELLKQATVSRNIYTRVEGNIATGCDVTIKNIPIKPIQTVAPTVVTTSPKTTYPFGSISFETQKNDNEGNKLSEATVAWITGGICVGSIAMILTLACGFHLIRKRYSGQFLADNESLNKSRKFSISDSRKFSTATSTRAMSDTFSPMSLKRPKASSIV